jgi:hypothetical protein
MCLFYLVSGLPTPDGVGRCWGGAGWGVCCRKGDRPKRAIAAARTGSDGVARKSRTAQWPQASTEADEHARPHSARQPMDARGCAVSRSGEASVARSQS